MTELQALLLLAVVVLFVLWLSARQTVAKVRAEVADLKKQCIPPPSKL